MQKSQFVARGGMLTAVSLALLFLASVLPTGQVGVCAVAGILPALPLSHRRVRMGVCVYGAALVLGWLIVPRKSVMLGYTVFGLYSLVKYAVERLRRAVPEWICKILFCNLSFALLFLALRAGFSPALDLLQGRNIVLLCVVLNLVFIAFDIAFSRLIGLLKRIFPAK